MAFYSYSTKVPYSCVKVYEPASGFSGLMPDTTVAIDDAPVQVAAALLLPDKLALVSIFP